MHHFDNLESIKLEQLIGLLSNIDGFLDSFNRIEIRNYEDLIEFMNKFTINNDSLSCEDVVLIRIIKEHFEKFKIDGSYHSIENLDYSKAVDEKIVHEFLKDTKVLKSGRVAFDKLPKRYKTITEKIAVEEIDFDNMPQRYKDSLHPYVLHLISEAYINGKIYSVGIHYMFKGIFNALKSINPYFNSEYGLLGSTYLIFQLQYLLGVQGLLHLDKHINSFTSKILSLIYLYLSRCISVFENKYNECRTTDVEFVNPFVIRLIELYNNRATLMLDYRLFYSNLFFGTNPDLHFMSDMYYAYEYGVENGLDFCVQDYYWDSLKMYRHGSLIPNDSGGYKDIEDETWNELTTKVNFRSKLIAEGLYRDFLMDRYDFSNQDIEIIRQYLEAKYINTEKPFNFIDFHTKK